MAAPSGAGGPPPLLPTFSPPRLPRCLRREAGRASPESRGWLWLRAAPALLGAQALSARLGVPAGSWARALAELSGLGRPWDRSRAACWALLESPTSFSARKRVKNQLYQIFRDAQGLYLLLSLLSSHGTKQLCFSMSLAVAGSCQGFQGPEVSILVEVLGIGWPGEAIGVDGTEHCRGMDFGAFDYAVELMSLRLGQFISLAWHTDHCCSGR